MPAWIRNLVRTLIIVVNFFSPLAKTGIFSVSSSNGQNIISLTYMKLRRTMPLYLLRYWCNTSTDPSFCPLHTSSPILQRSMWSSLVDAIHRVSGRSRVAPVNWVTVAGRWGANQDMCTEGSLWPDLHGFTRATSTSPRITAPSPYPTSHSSAIIRMGSISYPRCPLKIA